MKISTTISFAMVLGALAGVAQAEFLPVYNSAPPPSGDYSAAAGGAWLNLSGGGAANATTGFSGGTVTERLGVAESVTTSNGLVSFNGDTCSGCPQNANIVKGTITNQSLGASRISVNGPTASAVSGVHSELRGAGSAWSSIKR